MILATEALLILRSKHGHLALGSSQCVSCHLIGPDQRAVLRGWLVVYLAAAQFNGTFAGVK